MDALIEIHAKVESLWKTILLNQFHDVLPGSSIGMVYTECNQMLQGVLSSSYSLCQQLMELLVPTSFPTTASSALVLHNAIPREVVKDVAFNGTGHDRHDYTPSGKPILPPGQYIAGGSKFVGEVQHVPMATSSGTGAIAKSNYMMSGFSGAKLGADPVTHHVGEKEDPGLDEKNYIGAFAFCAHVPISTVEIQENGENPGNSSRDSHRYAQKERNHSKDCRQPSTFIHGERMKDGLYVLENAYIRVILDNGGILKSFKDKRVHPPRELIQQSGFMGLQKGHDEDPDSSWWGVPPSIATSSGPRVARESGEGNLLCLHDDLPFFWDAWDVFPYHLQTGAPLNTPVALAAGKYGQRGPCTNGRSKGKKKVTLASSSTNSTFMKSRRASKENEVPMFDTVTGTGLRVNQAKGEATLTVRVPLEMPDISSMNMQYYANKGGKKSASTSTNTVTVTKAGAGQGHKEKDQKEPLDASKAKKKKRRTTLPWPSLM